MRSATWGMLLALVANGAAHAQPGCWGTERWAQFPYKCATWRRPDYTLPPYCTLPLAPCSPNEPCNRPLNRALNYYAGNVAPALYPYYKYPDRGYTESRAELRVPPRPTRASAASQQGASE